jgi:hypothetical protein
VTVLWIFISAFSIALLPLLLAWVLDRSDEKGEGR